MAMAMSVQDEKLDKAAHEWLREYAGSVDTTALILAFKAGATQERAHWAFLDLCSVCGGQPLASGRKCVCDGVGTADAERVGLRRYALGLEGRRGVDMTTLMAFEAGQEDERERCIADAEGERLSGETGEESDLAYNTAIEHVIAAIRRRGSETTLPEGSANPKQPV